MISKPQNPKTPKPLVENDEIVSDEVKLNLTGNDRLELIMKEEIIPLCRLANECFPLCKATDVRVAYGYFDVWLLVKLVFASRRKCV